MSEKQSGPNYLPLQFSFLVFSMLLNCMGIIILKFSDTNISYHKLGILESFKDIPIALVSLVAVNLINRTGSKKALASSLLLVSLCCLLLPYMNEYWFFKIWFVLIGISFAIAKISVFGIIRSNAREEKQLSRIMNRVEASFMLGIFCVNMGFGWLLTSRYEHLWKFGFWGIAAFSMVTLYLLMREPFKDTPKETSHSFSGLRSVFTLRNVLFFMILFCIVLLEQCFNSWLPTFYKKNLHVTSFYALQSTAFLALFSFTGRMITSKIIRSFPVWRYLFFCLFCLVGLLLFSQYLLANTGENLWILLILLPVAGLFMSPLYPLYNSKFLIHVAPEKVNIIVSFIVIFSSLGSSVGSIGMSYVFHFAADRYFLLFALIPVVLILGVTFLFSQRLILRQ